MNAKKLKLIFLGAILISTQCCFALFGFGAEDFRFSKINRVNNATITIVGLGIPPINIATYINTNCVNHHMCKIDVLQAVNSVNPGLIIPAGTQYTLDIDYDTTRHTGKHKILSGNTNDNPRITIKSFGSHSGTVLRWVAAGAGIGIAIAAVI